MGYFRYFINFLIPCQERAKLKKKQAKKQKAVLEKCSFVEIKQTTETCQTFKMKLFAKIIREMFHVRCLTVFCIHICKYCQFVNVNSVFKVKLLLVQPFTILTKKLHYRCFTRSYIHLCTVYMQPKLNSVNSFMTRVSIIQKPVH